MVYFVIIVTSTDPFNYLGFFVVGGHELVVG